MDEDSLQICGKCMTWLQPTDVAGKGPTNKYCTTIPGQANGPNTGELSLLGDLGTILNPFTPALGATTANNANIATEGSTWPSRRTELENKIALLLEEYTLKDLEQHTTDLRTASTSVHAPARPTHN